jgi:hypothetical protein
LQFFDNKQFDNYWIDSGTSGSLYEYAKRHKLEPESYIGKYLTNSDLTSYEIDASPPENFLFQSGYLTFKTPESRRGHLLDYPNYEVRNTVSTLMLSAAYNIENNEQKTIANTIYDALDGGRCPCLLPDKV